MVNIYIDDIKYSVQEGLNIIQAAQSVGIDVPHFCWHPELSVSGNCRMCLVETGMHAKNPDGSFAFDENGEPKIVYMPKLSIACGTKVSEGMRIRVNSQKVIDTQEAVMEFILINHPLDCPICDEAGQCRLQEYSFTKGNGISRFIEEKNHKSKRTSWGPNVMYDGERCISCSRCIRFSKEFADQPVLSFTNRGDRVTIHLEEGKEFDNPYSMNVVDICPVGALTSKDFRFKSRVWDMSFNDSICNSCARSCNIKLGVRNNKVLRIEPRQNNKVNRHWMCDRGRLNYEALNENRLIAPTVAKQATSWENAYEAVANLLKEHKASDVLFILSPFQTNEAIFLSNKLIKEVMKGAHYGHFEYQRPNEADDKLRVAEKSPNQTGITRLFDKDNILTVDSLNELITKKNIKLLYIFDTNLHNVQGIESVLERKIDIIAHCTNNTIISNRANVALASASYAETEGTMTNFQQIVQHFTPALVIGENMRYMGLKMSRLDKFGADNDRWNQHEKRDLRSDWRIIQAISNKLSATWSYTNAEDVFNEITHINPNFKNMTYDKLDKYNGIKIGETDSNIIADEYKPYKTNLMKCINC